MNKKIIYALICVTLLGTVIGCKSQKIESFKNDKFLEMKNDSLSIKLDLTRGGAIAFISKSEEKRNLVNIHDEGRYIQQSYYAGKPIDRRDEGQSPRWSPWTWNPIQVGDAYFNRAQILKSQIKGNTAYTKCIPMLWDMNNKPAEAIMEQWTVLDGNVIKVKNRLTCQRTDSIYGEGFKRSQELPAVYPISSLSELYSYVGSEPFTNGPMKKLKVKFLQDGFWGRYQNNEITESWMAFVDQNNWGIAVYSPSTKSFLAGMSGRPGFEAESGSTSYIAPVKKVALYKNSVFEYEYYIVIGQLEKMREIIYGLRSKN